LPGINIVDDVVIGAGSIVTKDIPSGVIAVGNPCKVIRKLPRTTKKDTGRMKGNFSEYARSGQNLLTKIYFIVENIRVNLFRVTFESIGGNITWQIL
jgi:carbonic anhydrase/acetyltransferase-like protein (isoleucine patch superfamily)